MSAVSASPSVRSVTITQRASHATRATLPTPLRAQSTVPPSSTVRPAFTTPHTNARSVRQVTISASTIRATQSAETDTEMPTNRATTTTLRTTMDALRSVPSKPVSIVAILQSLEECKVTVRFVCPFASVA